MMVLFLIDLTKHALLQGWPTITQAQENNNLLREDNIFYDALVIAASFLNFFNNLYEKSFDLHKYNEFESRVNGMLINSVIAESLYKVDTKKKVQIFWGKNIN
jgi:hypothetical protein